MKKTFGALAAVLRLALGSSSVVASPDGEHHSQTPFERPPIALTLPSSPLVWGDVNVIHMMDTHGWLLGHQRLSEPESNSRFSVRRRNRFWTLTRLGYQRNVWRLFVVWYSI